MAYKLQWLSEVGEIVVNKQVLIHFSIGKYKDEVLCDVVPMEAVPTKSSGVMTCLAREYVGRAQWNTWARER